MSLEFLTLITRDICRAGPDARFVFGDNLARRGAGGQAREMRGEPNAIGVVTKRAPTMDENAFFTDDMRVAWLTVDDDIDNVAKALAQGRMVYVPKAGLGTGLSQLPTRAPKLYRHIVQRFTELAGEPIPWTHS